jgi:hypothetical protein
MIEPAAMLLLSLALLTSPSDAFAPMHYQHLIKTTATTTTGTTLGLFDGLLNYWSEEAQAERKARKEAELLEQEEAMAQKLERRNNPEKWAKYFEEVEQRRSGLYEEKAVYNFQQQQGQGDPLDSWKKLRAEGKVKVGSDLQRDPTTSRLGSEGLIDVRVDERMPYIDQGYVEDKTTKSNPPDLLNNVRFAMFSIMIFVNIISGYSHRATFIPRWFIINRSSTFRKKLTDHEGFRRK